jgi:hypothetical protein
MLEKSNEESGSGKENTVTSGHLVEVLYALQEKYMAALLDTCTKSAVSSPVKDAM